MKKPKEINLGDLVRIKWLDTCFYYSAESKINEAITPEKADVVETIEVGYLIDEKDGKYAIACTRVPNYYRKDKADKYIHITVVPEGAIVEWEILSSNLKE